MNSILARARLFCRCLAASMPVTHKSLNCSTIQFPSHGKSQSLIRAVTFSKLKVIV